MRLFYLSLSSLDAALVISPNFCCSLKRNIVSHYKTGKGQNASCNAEQIIQVKKIPHLFAINWNIDAMPCSYGNRRCS
ncbi:hypothetical protein DdX_08332 [Ditylenchus destructor]|uniref:Uncharacterized protein n=1 Tax=Ditylenchus destructor TaxID=166010 RepID=A0AAD4N8A3_9BILA|nr:hypothetical protein DdX_08332 [Ditylenchus destructor]